MYNMPFMANASVPPQAHHLRSATVDSRRPQGHVQVQRVRSATDGASRHSTLPGIEGVADSSVNEGESGESLFAASKILPFAAPLNSDPSPESGPGSLRLLTPPPSDSEASSSGAYECSMVVKRGQDRLVDSATLPGLINELLVGSGGLCSKSRDKDN